ncbi:DNA/RNA non-specific endonuclease, partial [Calidithermus terrae]
NHVAGGVLLGVLKNPGAFARNMIKAGKGGFEGFSKNARTHLTTGLGEWLTGASGGISFPRRLDDAMALLPTALGIMGFSYRNVRAKLVKRIGPQGEHLVSRAETATGGSLSAFQALKNSGLHKAKDMGEAASLIKTEAIGGIKNYVIAEVIKKAVIKVASLLIPGGGFVQAILSVFDTAMFFVERAKQIASLGSSILDSVSAIAAGNLTAATQRVELSLAKAIPVTLGFLSRFLGLGKIGNKLREIVNKVKGRVENVLDKIVARFTPVIKKWAQEPGIGKHDNPKAAQGGDHRTRAQKEADVGKAVADADKLLLADEATEQGIRSGLPAIKQRYKLSSISLVKEPDGAYHVTAVINPTARTPSRKLHTDFYPVSMDAEPNDKGILVKYTTRAGKSFQVQVGRSGHVTQAQGFSLDLTSLGRGVTQDPANKQKNAGQNSAHIIANWFGGSGYRTSLNLVATSDYFNKQVMGAKEREIAGWVRDNDIITFNLCVTVDWGQVAEEAVVAGMVDQLKSLAGSGLPDHKQEKIKQKILRDLVKFTPLLKAVEDVEYSGNGKSANGKTKIFGPVNTGPDRWLKLK